MTRLLSDHLRVWSALVVMLVEDMQADHAPYPDFDSQVVVARR